MIILVLINIVILIYIYLKYYKIQPNINSINENLEDRESIIIGYINDRDSSNNFDLILAEIISLNIKGYITIQYEKDSIDKYHYKIKQNIDARAEEINKYEMLVLNFLFSNNTEITKEELENKLKNTFNSYNTRYNELKEILNKELVLQDIIDINKQKALEKTTKIYIKVSIILTLIISLLGAFEVLNISKFYMVLYVIEKIVSCILLLKANAYTPYGRALKNKIEAYKIDIKSKEFLLDKNTMEEIVKNSEFANSIALHIDTVAKKAFIDDKMIKEASKMAKKTISMSLKVSALLLLLTFIISKVTVSIPKEGIFWLYLIISVIIACIADITYMLRK